MRVRFSAILALAVSAGALSGLPGPAFAGEAAASQLLLAQNAYQPIPQPSARRAGELEDWSASEKKAPAKAAPARKTSAAAAAPKEKKAAPKEARDPQDGGIPLPSSGKVDDGAPIGFDAKGNMGTSLRF